MEISGNTEEYRVGNKSICRMCGKEIVYTRRRYWSHTTYSPRHPGEPIDRVVFKVGDKVEVLLHSRCKGYSDTGGGWSSDWIAGTVVKVNPKTITVYTDEYYFRHLRDVPKHRIRLIS